LALDLKKLRQDLEVEARLKRRDETEGIGAQIATSSERTGVATSNESTVRTTDVAKPRATSSLEYLLAGIERHKRGALLAAAMLVVIMLSLAYLYSTFRTESFHDNSLQNEIDYKGLMVLIPAGEFIMGSDNSDDDEKPAHSVSLQAYYIDKFEVTNKQYREFCDATGRAQPKNPPFEPDYFVNKPDFPVMGVQFNDAVEYANFVGKRLPTEEEWEKAASWDPNTQRKHIWPWGDDHTPGRANLDTKHPAAVGRYVNDRSAYNVYDMAGNVFEWVDGFYQSYDGKRDLGGKRVKGLLVRGGVFLVSLYEARNTYRNYFPKTFPSGMAAPIGIRCVVSENDKNLKDFLNSPRNK
jgi:formylglycine-generating enzyme required for sulfatase activity